MENARMYVQYSKKGGNSDKNDAIGAECAKWTRKTEKSSVGTLLRHNLVERKSLYVRKSGILHKFIWSIP